MDLTTTYKRNTLYRTKETKSRTVKRNREKKGTKKGRKKGKEEEEEGSGKEKEDMMKKIRPTKN